MITDIAEKKAIGTVYKNEEETYFHVGIHRATEIKIGRIKKSKTGISRHKTITVKLENGDRVEITIFLSKEMK